MKAPEAFVTGFLLAIVIMTFIMTTFAFDSIEGNALNKAGRLGVSVTTAYGNMYYWDEQNKVSYKIEINGLKAIIASREPKDSVKN